MADSPVSRAWIFGSFARMEERPDSDIDVLVDFEKDIKLGLLGFSSLVQQMEGAVGRKVDLVEHGSLKPFARENVEREKVLIYERAC
ncbi:MAG: nucleotidyltransferase domain-containing protein [Bacteroidales bacterium]|nr:nucleotidyltransferase domain-containing protein [Bacteroidales bacterium]